MQRFYGIIPDSEAHEEDEEDDIEASIRNEVASMENQKQSPKLFTLIYLDVPCVIFFKTGPAVEPLDFVHRICEEVVAKPDIRKMRYVNRLTPVTSFAKATEKGLEEVAKNVLPRHFRLNVEGTENQAEDTTENTTYPSVSICELLGIVSPSPVWQSLTKKSEASKLTIIVCNSTYNPQS